MGTRRIGSYASFEAPAAVSVAGGGAEPEIRKLREEERLAAEGKDVAEVAR